MSEREQSRSFEGDGSKVEALVYCAERWCWTSSAAVGGQDFVAGFRALESAKRACTQHMRRHGLKATGRTWEDV